MYGYLFLVRNDLVAGLPPLPKLAAPVQTKDLNFSKPVCDWGHVPDYLRSEPAGPTVDLDVGAFRNARDIAATGWIYDFDANQSAERVLMAVDGSVVAETDNWDDRPDVAAAFDDAHAPRERIRHVRGDLRGR